MKKGLVFAVVLFFVGQGFLFANRAAIDEFFRSYEALVVETESLSTRANITVMDMMPLSQRAMEFSERTAAVQNNPAFTAADATRLVALTNRYTTAMNQINNRLQAGTPGMPAVPGLPGF